MDTATAETAGRVDERPPAPRRALAALCVTQITSWGVLFYAFPVLAGAIGSDTGWSTGAVMGAFSTGLAVSALAGIPAGRLLDRYGPRPVMTSGSVIATLAVLCIAAAPGPLWFTAAWALAGSAQACVFYKPAFAAITVWYGPARVKALTTLTLVAGLASTIFAPLTAALTDHLSWRESYVVLAILLAVITVPAHAVALDPPWIAQAPTRRDGGSKRSTSRRAIMRSPAFIALSGAMALATFAMFAATLYLVPLLTGRGMDTTTAAWALGLCGAGQLLGRIGYAPLVEHAGPTMRTIVILICAAVTTAAVAIVTGPTAVVFTVVIALGAARGAFTLLEATAVSDRWGTSGYATLHGVFSAPATIAIALGPWAGALLTDWTGDHPQMFALLATIALTAAAIALLAPAARRKPVPMLGGEPPKESPKRKKSDV